MNNRIQQVIQRDAQTPPVRNRSGLTLVDLSLTIMLIGIMAVTTIPKMSAQSLNHYRLESAATQVVAELEMVRRYAKTAGTDQTVTFSTNLNRITMLTMPDMNHPAINRIIELSDMDGAITLISANFGGQQTLTFDVYGRPANGGTVVLQSGVNQKTIAVDGTSGRISLL